MQLPVYTDVRMPPAVRPTHLLNAPSRALPSPHPPRAEIRASNADAPARYLALVRQLLGMGLSSLQETPAKIANARSRLAQVGGTPTPGQLEARAVLRAGEPRLDENRAAQR